MHKPQHNHIFAGTTTRRRHTAEVGIARAQATQMETEAPCKLGTDPTSAEIMQLHHLLAAAFRVLASRPNSFHRRTKHDERAIGRKSRSESPRARNVLVVRQRRTRLRIGKRPLGTGTAVDAVLCFRSRKKGRLWQKKMVMHRVLGSSFVSRYLTRVSDDAMQANMTHAHTSTPVNACQVGKLACSPRWERDSSPTTTPAAWLAASLGEPEELKRMRKEDTHDTRR